MTSSPGDVEGLVERPLAPLMADRKTALWMQIDLLFQKHGLDCPPYALRDELVTHLAWAQCADEAAARLTALSRQVEEMRGALEAADKTLTWLWINALRGAPADRCETAMETVRAALSTQKGSSDE